MNNYLEYIDKYKDYTFIDKPYNEIDILIFSQLSYLSLENIDFNNKKYTLKEISTLIDRESIKSYIIAQIASLKLLDKLINTKRYSNIYLIDFSYKLDKDYQFGVATFDIGKYLVVAFQGTDSNISGWLEDAMLSYIYPTESQILAGRYINALIGKYHKKIIVCGHSKGGNLALVGSMRTFFLKQIFIKEIYSFDGPGLREKEFNSIQYKLIKKKLHNIIPNQSIIGVLFLQDDMDVIKTNTTGIMAHAADSWLISDDKFIRTKQSLISINLDKSINNWLSKYNLEERALIVYETFNILDKAGIKKVHDLTDNHLKGLFKVFKESNNIDKDTKKVLFNSFKLLNYTLAKTIIDTETTKIKKIFIKDK